MTNPSTSTAAAVLLLAPRSFPDGGPRLPAVEEPTVLTAGFAINGVKDRDVRPISSLIITCCSRCCRRSLCGRYLQHIAHRLEDETSKRVSMHRGTLKQFLVHPYLKNLCINTSIFVARVNQKLLEGPPVHWHPLFFPPSGEQWSGGTLLPMTRTPRQLRYRRSPTSATAWVPEGSLAGVFGCHGMTLELVSGADFWCNLMFRASPGDLGGSRGRFSA